MTLKQWAGWCKTVADKLDAASRTGPIEDEPEGTCTLVISHTWAEDHATILRRLAKELDF